MTSKDDPAALAALAALAGLQLPYLHCLPNQIHRLDRIVDLEAQAGPLLGDELLGVDDHKALGNQWGTGGRDLVANTIGHMATRMTVRGRAGRDYREGGE